MTQTTADATDTVFKQIRFVMVKPSHPGNVGAAARAIKTMGFKELCLVAPKFDNMIEHADAIALASGANDILSQTRIVPSLEQALAPVSLTFALTARPRYLGPPPLDIRQSATLAAEHIETESGMVAMVLGTERTGLSNDDLDLCQHLCHIPANPGYSSLNVAQALQLAAWELRYALLDRLDLDALPHTNGKVDPGSLTANNGLVADFLTHWEQALIAVDFLDPEHPKKLLPRMRQLFSRSRLSINEVAMLRGLCTSMIKTAAKAAARNSQ
ncbi:RNA methyltransferase [Paenalcaligenes niemegkensis]|uniref:RNA methyltransferase n=1 Tax=Paenalcaligenes niemegkensis TaxID=2895469 RepID=UPI001EE92E65|nr:RNA methyltransferase [Paenalcaligenes niemegkensis]MCQ9615757.1 RNA methyltransferase [Paenalcaligenes niemegkensis]